MTVSHISTQRYNELFAKAQGYLFRPETLGELSSAEIDQFCAELLFNGAISYTLDLLVLYFKESDKCVQIDKNHALNDSIEAAFIMFAKLEMLLANAGTSDNIIVRFPAAVHCFTCEDVKNLLETLARLIFIMGYRTYEDAMCYHKFLVDLSKNEDFAAKCKYDLEISSLIRIQLMTQSVWMNDLVLHMVPDASVHRVGRDLLFASNAVDTLTNQAAIQNYMGTKVMSQRLGDPFFGFLRLSTSALMIMFDAADAADSHVHSLCNYGVLLMLLNWLNYSQMIDNNFIPFFECMFHEDPSCSRYALKQELEESNPGFRIVRYDSNIASAMTLQQIHEDFPNRQMMRTFSAIPAEQAYELILKRPIFVECFGQNSFEHGPVVATACFDELLVRLKQMSMSHTDLQTYVNTFLFRVYIYMVRLFLPSDGDIPLLAPEHSRQIETLMVELFRQAKKKGFKPTNQTIQQFLKVAFFQHQARLLYQVAFEDLLDAEHDKVFPNTEAHCTVLSQYAYIIEHQCENTVAVDIALIFGQFVFALLQHDSMTFGMLIRDSLMQDDQILTTLLTYRQFLFRYYREHCKYMKLSKAFQKMSSCKFLIKDPLTAMNNIEKLLGCLIPIRGVPSVYLTALKLTPDMHAWSIEIFLKANPFLKNLLLQASRTSGKKSGSNMGAFVTRESFLRDVVHFIGQRKNIKWIKEPIPLSLNISKASQQNIQLGIFHLLYLMGILSNHLREVGSPNINTRPLFELLAFYFENLIEKHQCSYDFQALVRIHKTKPDMLKIDGADIFKKISDAIIAYHGKRAAITLNTPEEIEAWVRSIQGAPQQPMSQPSSQKTGKKKRSTHKNARQKKSQQKSAQGKEQDKGQAPAHKPKINTDYCAQILARKKACEGGFKAILQELPHFAVPLKEDDRNLYSPSSEDSGVGRSSIALSDAGDVSHLSPQVIRYTNRLYRHMAALSRFPDKPKAFTSVLFRVAQMLHVLVGDSPDAAECFDDNLEHAVSLGSRSMTLIIEQWNLALAQYVAMMTEMMATSVNALQALTDAGYFLPRIGTFYYAPRVVNSFSDDTYDQLVALQEYAESKQIRLLGRGSGFVLPELARPDVDIHAYAIDEALTIEKVAEVLLAYFGSNNHPPKGYVRYTHDPDSPDLLYCQFQIQLSPDVILDLTCYPSKSFDTILASLLGSVSTLSAAYFDFKRRSLYLPAHAGDAALRGVFGVVGGARKVPMKTLLDIDLGYLLRQMAKTWPLIQKHEVRLRPEIRDFEQHCKDMCKQLCESGELDDSYNSWFDKIAGAMRHLLDRFQGRAIETIALSKHLHLLEILFARAKIQGLGAFLAYMPTVYEVLEMQFDLFKYPQLLGQSYLGMLGYCFAQVYDTQMADYLMTYLYNTIWGEGVGQNVFQPIVKTLAQQQLIAACPADTVDEGTQDSAAALVPETVFFRTVRSQVVGAFCQDEGLTTYDQSSEI